MTDPDQPGRPGPAAFPPGPPLLPPPPPAPPGTVRATGDWGPPPDETPVPSRRVPFWVVGMAILAVGALIGGMLAVFTQGDDDDEAGASPPPSEEGPAATDPPTTTLPPADFDDVVADIEAFVAAERGLPFLRDVTVELADEGEFQDRLLEDFEEDAAEIETTGRVLEALGLLPPGTDVVESFRGLLGAGVVGFYDSATDELVVRGGTPTPYVRAVIAHELTHALDDQHFELERPELDDADDESGFGFTGLVEGSASVVEAAYRATFTDEEEQQAAAEEQRIGEGYEVDLASLSLLESLIAPYVLGPGLIEALLDDGGQARLDASFGAPPTTSEALLDPSTYVDGEPTVAVAAPTPEGPEIDRGVVGAMGVAQILGELTQVVAGFGEVSDAVDGWGGDAYVAWTDGDRTCVRAHLVGDTPGDTEELGEALGAWAAAPPFEVEATVEVGDVVVLTSCG